MIVIALLLASYIDITLRRSESSPDCGDARSVITRHGHAVVIERAEIIRGDA